VTEEQGSAGRDPDQAPSSGAAPEAPGPDPEDEPVGKEGRAKGRDPVRLATLVVLGVCALFFALYVWADRVMPYSDQARVSGYAVPIAPQVSGYVTDIAVGLHEVVEGGDVLVEIDTLQYRIAVRSARAQLDNAIQEVGGATASVEAAAAGVAAARAQEAITLRDFERISSIRERDPTAISQADRDRAEAAHLLGERRHVLPRAERHDAEALGELGRDGEGLLADAAGAAEQREPLQRGLPPLRTCALVRPKRRSRPA